MGLYSMKNIAFYLPQFHEVPENNLWWGEGYTEWMNVKKCKRLFPNHYQPRIPLNENYYSLDDINVMKWQAKLANKYGVDGFCFYHYWFGNGKKMLEKPVEKLRMHAEIEIEYCFAWANEPWSRTWQGPSGGQEILIRQEYGNEEVWEKHFSYLLNFFKDIRYIKINNKPLFLIYRIGDIKCADKMFEYWDKMAKKEGFDGIYILSMLSYEEQIKISKYVSGTVDFEPGKSRREEKMLTGRFRQIKDLIIENIHNTKLVNGLLCNFLDYDEVNSAMLKKKHNKGEYRGVFVNYDDSPRRGIRGTIVKGSTPQKFQRYFSENVKKSIKEGNEMIFINAWNEWGEGNYLEPDQRYGYAYLNAIRKVMKGIR